MTALPMADATTTARPGTPQRSTSTHTIVSHTENRARAWVTWHLVPEGSERTACGRKPGTGGEPLRDSWDVTCSACRRTRAGRAILGSQWRVRWLARALERVSEPVYVTAPDRETARLAADAHRPPGDWATVWVERA